MAESGEASKPWSNGTRSAALIAAMLPVAVGVFQEAQEARGRRADHQQQQQTQREQAQQAAVKADQEAARVLLSSFVDLSAAQPAAANGLRTASDAFCTRLQFAAAQLSDQKLTPQTHAVMISALKLVDRKGDRKVCDCADPGAARQIWFGALKDNIERTTDVSSSTALIQELRTTESECTAKDPPLPEAVVVAVPPLPAPQMDCRLDAVGFTERVRVFVQIPGEDARADAVAFLAQVNAAPPFKGPGAEVVGVDRAPIKLEIRYAYDQDRPAAVALRKALTVGCQKTGSEPLIRQITQYQGRVDPRVLEVWWPKPPSPPKATP